MVVDDTFEELLEQFNSKKRLNKKNVLLVGGNAAGHYIEKESSNVKLHYLPPKIASIIQPCDAGIIKSYKVEINFS